MKKIVIETSYSNTGFCCACDLLKGWVVTGSDDFETFKREVRESIAFYVQCAKEDGEEYPAELDGDYELEYRFDVRSLLQLYQGIFSFASLQAITGINQKQLSHYAAGRSKPRRAQAEKINNGLHNLARQIMSLSV